MTESKVRRENATDLAPMKWGFRCRYCRQRIKPFTPRMPVKVNGELVGHCHPGCALKGSRINERAKQLRTLITGRKV